jgi:hypothetical protein
VFGCYRHSEGPQPHDTSRDIRPAASSGPCRCGASAPPLFPRRCGIFFRCHPEHSEGSASAFLRPRPRFFPVLASGLPAGVVSLCCSTDTTARNPFRITFFAHPHPLTSIESYSYKKQGVGGTFFSPGSRCFVFSLLPYFLVSNPIRDRPFHPLEEEQPA